MAENKSSRVKASRKRKRDLTDEPTRTRNGPGATGRSKLVKTVPAQPIENEYGRIYCSWPDDLGIENPERYRPGGLHPVHLGEFIDNGGRFEVLHKLGHGDNSTAWLCYDAQDCILVAIKVLSADTSTEESPELKISALFSDTPREELEENHIALPREHFWIDGPNGHHLCTVSEFLAANSCIPPSGMGQHNPDILNELCYQICKGMQYLHANGVCHGDMRKDNLAMQVDMSGIDVPELIKYLGQPFTWELETLSGQPPEPWGPKYLVAQPSMRSLESRFGTGRLMIMDFGLAYEASNPPKKQIFYRSNAAPELLFKKSCKGKATDIWALGCILCEIVRGRWIFDQFDKYPDLIRRFESFFGPFPPYLRQGVHDILEMYEYQPSRNKSTRLQHQASRTRSGKNYQANGLTTSEYNMEGFKRDLEDYKKISGWSHRLQGYLSYRQQCRRYWERLEEPLPEPSEEGSRSENENNESNISNDEVTANCQVRKESTASKSSSSSVPQGDRRASNTISESYMPKRLIKSDLGTWPEPDNPCTCYTRDADGGFSRNESICDARDHYIYDPDQTTMFALTKDEVLSFSDLLLGIFKYNHKERFTIDDVLNHEWFADTREWFERQGAGTDYEDESASSQDV
ncbi:kinase-like domain-containing protein [Biscogniauxia marginata]|nr:kinase-like domain-containing protein [Biscogniauxia marginata]